MNVNDNNCVKHSNTDSINNCTMIMIVNDG